MVEQSTGLSRGRFLQYVDRASLAQVETALGYAHPRRRNGELTMARDWHVSYHRSRWHGKPCVYFVWSAIEHIFTEEKK
jgi:hypothetical protein